LIWCHNPNGSTRQVVGAEIGGQRKRHIVSDRLRKNDPIWKLESGLSQPAPLFPGDP
jgi:hypothetical protein